MKKRFLKKIMAAAAAMLLTIGSVVPAMAADITPVSKESKITLYLYGSNSPSDQIGTGTVNDSSSLPNGSEPIKDATFKYEQVGNIVQYNDGSTVGIRYQITNQAFASAVGISESNSDVSDGQSYIVPDTLMQKLMADATASGAVESFINSLKSICNNETAQTDDSGKVEISDLSGVYVFIGDSMPAEVTSHVTPFLVSAPMPNLDGTGWNTEIHVYPKVANNEMTLTKSVSQGTSQGTHILVESGSDISYTVSLTIPGKAGDTAVAKFEKFELKDTMAAGLKPVYGQDSSGLKVNGTSFTTASKEIEVKAPSVDNKYTTTVVFLQAGLEKLNNDLEKGDVTVTLTYKAKLGDGATLGISGNANNAQVVYQRAGGAEGRLATTSNVHTYGIDVTKTLSDGTAVGSREINFKLSRISQGVDGKNVATPIKFSSVNTTSGSISKTTYWADDMNAGSSDVLRVPSDGKLRIYGLLPGIYQLEETKSANGYTKLEKPITIIITAPENSDTYSTNNAAATADGQNMLTDDTHAFQLTVVNTKQSTGFTLPKTGGEGTLVALAIGFGLVGAAVLMLLAYRRKMVNNQKNR